MSAADTGSGSVAAPIPTGYRSPTSSAAISVSGSTSVLAESSGTAQSTSTLSAGRVTPTTPIPITTTAEPPLVRTASGHMTTAFVESWTVSTSAPDCSTYVTMQAGGGSPPSCD